MQIELTLPSAENKPIQNPYFLFFESNPQPMWLVDRETLRFIDVNAAAVRMYGYPREAFLRMSVLDIQAVDGVDAFLKAWYQFEDNSRARLPGEWNHISKSGSRLTVELLRARSDPYAKEELVICRDITARKQVEGCLAVRYALTRVLSEMPADATSQILRGLCNGLGFESAELWLADPRGATLQRRDTWSNPALQPLADVAPSAMTYLNPGLLARVCRSGSAVWTPQRSFQHGWADSAAHDPGIRGALCSQFGAGPRTAESSSSSAEAQKLLRKRCSICSPISAPRSGWPSSAAGPRIACESFPASSSKAR